MNQIIYKSLVGLMVVGLVSGCQKEDTATKQQLAQLQAQLDNEKAEKQKAEQEAREEKIRQETEKRVKAKLKMETAEKNKQEQSATQTKFTQKVANYPASVVTQSGYGELSLRGEPSNTGLKVGSVYHGDEVIVRARTNKCEVINSIDGCWVKVQIKDKDIQGYMFDGYLQREVLSQEEKANLQGRPSSSEENEEEIDP